MTGDVASARRLRTAWLRWALVTVPAVVLPGLVSIRIGDSGYGNIWFDRLAKPAIMPPGWVFPFSLSILTIVMGAALAFILNARGAKGRGVAMLVFVVQLALFLAWPPVFFAMHRIVLAFGIVVAAFVWASAATLIFWRISRAAALLMLPCLGWLLFVGLLNWQVHQRNPNGLTLVPSTGDTQIIIQ